MNEKQVLKILKAAIRTCGSARAFAYAHDIDTAIVSRVAAGKVRPARCVLNALRLKKVVTVSYRRKK